MLETRINVTFYTKNSQIKSLFESLILHLRLSEINVMADGRTSVWEASTLQGINIFLQQPSDLEKAAEAIREFFTTRIYKLQLCSWQTDGREVKVIIRGIVNYNENPVPQSALEYIIE